MYAPDAAIRALNDISVGMSCLKTAREWGVFRTTLIDLHAGRYSVHSRLVQ